MRDEQKTLDFCARLAISFYGRTEGTGCNPLTAIDFGMERWSWPKLGDPLGGDGALGAAVAAGAGGVGVEPGAPVFLVEEFDEDALLVGAAGRAAEGIDDGVLLRVVEDAVDKDCEVGAEQREVDAEFAEGGGLAGLRYRSWNLVAGDGGGFERFALVGIFAGGGDRADEGVAVGDDQAADDPCCDVVLGQFASLVSERHLKFQTTTKVSRTTNEMDARRRVAVSP
jgi:hypothetical protein